MKNVFIKATLIVAIISGTIMFNACNEKEENNNKKIEKTSTNNISYDIINNMSMEIAKSHDNIITSFLKKYV
jgi:putative IMPACT (imprinted ancient) family translation regulator